MPVILVVVKIVIEMRLFDLRMEREAEMRTCRPD